MVNLKTLPNGLARIKASVLDGTLTLPDGTIFLGIARFVTDWVDDLNGPLHHSASRIENII
jgi:hypothetical protein